MNVVIIEDESLAVERLTKLLYEYDEQIKILAIADTVEAAVAYFNSHASTELIFLDIELGDGKSFDIFEQVKVNSYIIFVTAFDEYAIKAFKYNSIDYLLKPVKKEDLFFALDKYKAQAIASRENINFTAPIQQLQPKQNKASKSRFLVKRGSRFASVETKDVAHIFTRDRLHFIKTMDGTEYMIDTNLDELEEQLSPEIFYRANRQFIINYSTITDVITWFDGKLKIVVKPPAYEEIIISRLKAGSFKSWLDK